MKLRLNTVSGVMTWALEMTIWSSPMGDTNTGDGEDRKTEAADRRAEVAFRQVVRKLVRRSAERDDEGQIVKELQRSRRTMRLVWITGRKRSAPMAPSEANLSHTAILPGALLRKVECC